MMYSPRKSNSTQITVTTSELQVSTMILTSMCTAPHRTSLNRPWNRQTQIRRVDIDIDIDIDIDMPVAGGRRSKVEIEK